MLDILLIPFVICLILSVKKRRDADPLNVFPKTHTGTINGICVLLIFVRHFSEYIQAGRFDWVLGKGQRYLDQLIVVPFLFFSGYSFFVQYRRDSSYIKKLPSKIFVLWLMFVITVIAFALVQLLKGNSCDLPTLLLSMVGIKKVGNSNWYVFAIMFMWLFSYLSFGQKKAEPLIVLGILILCYMIVFSQFLSKDPVMYNTVISYPFGILCAKHDKRIFSLFRDKKICSAAILLGMAALAVVPFHNGNFILFELCVTASCGFLIAFSTIFHLESRIFGDLNRYAFEIYLVQRIPMILLAGRINSNLLYFILSALMTVPLAFFWKTIHVWLQEIQKP